MRLFYLISCVGTLYSHQTNRNDFMMLSKLSSNRNGIYYILIIHLIIRTIIAIFTNFGIDEVYYVSYGLYPDWSFFDHPPMISILMRLTTLDMRLMDEFFIRLGALIIGTANIYILFKIGYALKDRTTGIISALLASASIYSSIIVGTFILPDTPQSLFWILSLLLFINHIQSGKNKFILLFGITVGFAMLSKYHGIFLWGGAILYFITYKWRKLFSRPVILSGLLTILIFSPVIIWNLNNDLSSFNFHSSRIGDGSWLPNFKNFLPEFFGQIFYNNPFNVALIVASLIYFFKNRDWAISKSMAFLLYSSIPLVILVLGMSAYNKTLPHWTGPAYYGLIIISSIYASSYLIKKSHKLVNRYVWGGNIFFISLLLIAFIQIHIGLFNLSTEADITRTGKKDPSVDLFVWGKARQEINDYLSNKVEANELNNDYKILTHKWFPAAHLDYYFAIPYKKQLFVLGNINKQHIYKRINHLRGDLNIGSDVCYITTSLQYKEPNKDLFSYFEHGDEAPKMITIKRGKHNVMNIFIWQFTNLQKILPL